MVWPYLKVFWLSKDSSIGHSERKKEKRWTEEEVGIQYLEVALMDFANSTRAAEDRWKGMCSIV